ncbi:MAG: thioredoxin family protein [candidate division WOR-3 bacterium]
MEIRILGTGCPRCQELEKRTLEVLAEMNLAADVQKVTDLKKIAEYKVFMTPALVINGKVKCFGKVPAKSEIKKWLEEEKGK